jgi:hypothetical protein
VSAVRANLIPLQEFRIQLLMEPPVVPPEKRTSFASPAMVYVIVGIIAASFLLFLVFRP